MIVAILLALMLTLNPGPGLTDQPRQTVLATAYCLPGKTASGPTTGAIHAVGGCIALPRNLEQTLGAKFGDIIEVQGIGRFIYADRMPKRCNKVDIYHTTYKAARIFGVRRTQVRVVVPGGGLEQLNRLRKQCD